MLEAVRKDSYSFPFKLPSLNIITINNPNPQERKLQFGKGSDENLEMAPKAIAGLGCKRTEAKWPIWNIAVDSITARGRHADPPWASTACTKSTYLKSP